MAKAKIKPTKVNKTAVKRSSSSTRVAKAAPKALTEDKNSTTFSFGITFAVNGIAVPISVPDISRIASDGLDLKLPNPVVLGSFADLLQWLDDEFGVTLPPPADLPEYIQKIVDGIINMGFTVNVFELNIPPTAKDLTEEQTSQATTYALEITGLTSPDYPIELKVPGFTLSILGGTFGATNVLPTLET
jgi:hypothetical protein